jgi:hypothetical protein
VRETDCRCPLQKRCQNLNQVATGREWFKDVASDVIVVVPRKLMLDFDDCVSALTLVKVGLGK